MRYPNDSGDFLDTTIDEWRTELECQDDPGLTINEIACETKMVLRTAQARIKQMLKSGKCKQGFAIRIDAIGRRQRVPVYQLINKGKKEKT